MGKTPHAVRVLQEPQIFGAAQETTSVERHSTPLYIIVGQIPSVGQQDRNGLRRNSGRRFDRLLRVAHDLFLRSHEPNATSLHLQSGSSLDSRRYGAIARSSALVLAYAPPTYTQERDSPDLTLSFAAQHVLVC